MEELTAKEEELAAKVASMIKGKKLEELAMEFHLRQLKWNPTTVANPPPFPTSNPFWIPATVGREAKIRVGFVCYFSTLFL